MVTASFWPDTKGHWCSLGGNQLFIDISMVSGFPHVSSLIIHYLQLIIFYTA